MDFPCSGKVIKTDYCATLVHRPRSRWRVCLCVCTQTCDGAEAMHFTHFICMYVLEILGGTQETLHEEF